MEIKLLNNNKGFILTRQPEIIQDNLYITFSGAPENATAIFQNSKDSLYRLLSDGSCEVPFDFLEGEIKITVAVLNGTTNSLKWVCEELKATKQAIGVLVCPNDMDLPSKVVSMELELQEINENIGKLSTSYSELETKLTQLLEGYDIT